MHKNIISKYTIIGRLLHWVFPRQKAVSARRGRPFYVFAVSFFFTPTSPPHAINLINTGIFAEKVSREDARSGFLERLKGDYTYVFFDANAYAIKKYFSNP